MLSQNMVLNKLLDTKDLSIVTSNDIDVKYFFNYSDEFNFIMNHYNNYGQVPDKAVFINTFPNFELQTVSEPNSYLLDELFKDYNLNYIATNFNTMKKIAESGDAQEALELLEKASLGIRHGAAIQPIELLSNTSRYDHYLDRTVNQNQYYISTGFPELDKIIGGIDCKNENMVLAARTGIGKTMCMLTIAAAASRQGKRVGIFEGEMSVDKVGYRIDTNLGNINNTAINRGDLFTQQEYKRYIDSLASIKNGPIFVITPTEVAGGRVTVDTLRAFVEQNKLDILFIDQYSLLEDTSKARTSFERVGNIAKAIKQLQVYYKIPVIAVAQMNRTKNEDGSQDTTQIGLSDMIPQYATILLMLDRDKNDSQKLTINIVKARDGGDGKKLTYCVDWNYAKYTYIPEELDSVSSEEDLQELENSYEVEL